jgi:ribosome maturation protein SDO1
MQTKAKLHKQGKHYEILVDLDEALKFKKGTGSINSAVLTNAIFSNLKAGDQASTADLEKAFGTTEVMAISERIIKMGEIEMPESYLKKEHEGKYKQVVDFLSKNVVDANGRPYTPERLKRALEDAKVNVKNVPIEAQVADIIEQLRKIIPIKIEMKKYRLTIPAQHTGRGYGVVKKFMEKEDWLGNGDLQIVVNVPAGLVMDFFDDLNGVTHGSALSEEVKK